MNQSTFLNLAGWSAVLGGVTSIISSASLMIFFAVGGPWGTINDGVSVIWALTFIPLTVLFYRLNKNTNSALNRAITIIGFGAIVAFAVLQLLLTARLVRFEQTFTLVLIMGGLIGAWLMVQGLKTRLDPNFPGVLRWLMIAFGLSYILSMSGFLIGGWENPLAIAGFLAGAIMGPIWGIWLGKILVAEPLASTIVA